jgi:hypothetical protein
LFKDDGYQEIIETNNDEMTSSHSIKRFFGCISLARVWLFRKILLIIFIERLKIEKPDVIKLGIDTMVMDNDEAAKREGVSPTYKKVKGFQPLQMTWGRYLIDAIFREGKRHSNYSNHVIKMVRTVVKWIRKYYKKDVQILLRADTGFFDEKNLHAFEEMDIFYIVGGKIYNDIKGNLSNIEEKDLNSYNKGKNFWFYTEFEDKRSSWKDSRRAIYTKPLKEGEQLLFDFARPETIIYTNIRLDNTSIEQLIDVCGQGCLGPEFIIEEYHLRGKDELVHRCLKDFGTERLPFKRFASNAHFLLHDGYCLQFV